MPNAFDHLCAVGRANTQADCTTAQTARVLVTRESIRMWTKSSQPCIIFSKLKITRPEQDLSHLMTPKCGKRSVHKDEQVSHEVIPLELPRVARFATLRNCPEQIVTLSATPAATGPRPCHKKVAKVANRSNISPATQCRREHNHAQ